MQFMQVTSSFEGYFRYLGIDFSHDLFEMVQYNYSEKIKQIKDQMSLWLKRVINCFRKNNCCQVSLGIKIKLFVFIFTKSNK